MYVSIFSDFLNISPKFIISGTHGGNISIG